MLPVDSGFDVYTHFEVGDAAGALHLKRMGLSGIRLSVACVRSRSAADLLLQLLRIASSLHCDPADGAVDVSQIVGRQFECNCA